MRGLGEGGHEGGDLAEEGGLAVMAGVWQEYVRTGREMKQKMALTLGPVLCNCRFLSSLIVPVKSFLQKKQVEGHLGAWERLGSVSALM